MKKPVETERVKVRWHETHCYEEEFSVPPGMDVDDILEHVACLIGCHGAAVAKEIVVGWDDINVIERNDQ